jgi:hypothetical protein
MFRAFLWYCILTITVACSASAQDFSCGNKKLARLAITTSKQLYLQCTVRWPDTATTSGTFELWVFPNDWRDDPTKGPLSYTAGSLARWDQSDYHLKLDLAQPIQADKKYILILRTAATPGVIDMFIEFSTEGKGAAANETKGAIAPNGTSAELGRVFVVTSSTNSSASVTISPTTNRRTFTVPTAIALSNQPALELTETRGSKTVINHSIDKDGDYLTQSKPEETGVVNVELTGGKKLRQQRVTVGVAPKTGQADLKNVLQQVVKVGEPIDLQPAPVGKDDATSYIQFSHFVGVGSKPGYSINIKEKSFLFLDRDLYAGDYLIQPDIVVDIGTNNLAKKTDDTIKIGFTGTKTWLRKDSERFLQGLRFGPGVTYETNRGFHKNNLLFTFDSNPLLKDLYQSREARRYEAAAKSGKTSISEIDERDYKWGGGLEFFFGLETGGSLNEQTFQNKKKTTSLNIQQYSIFRFRPRVHAFVEYDRFSLDWSGTLRGLLTPEYVGEELDDGTIRLRRVTSWQAYSELTASYIIDPSKHIAFSVTYKRGAQPPLYPHVQTVSSGFTLKY